MNQVSTADIESFLESLRKACTSSNPSRKEIKAAMLRILRWLNEPSNNTDENCRKVDLYVTWKINYAERKRLSQDVEDILFDIGGALHDTYSNPEVAENFQSTLKRLLERASQL